MKALFKWTQNNNLLRIITDKQLKIICFLKGYKRPLFDR
jgi:hypothetical protein